MSSNIVLNKSNIVNLDEGNNKLVYHFPNDTEFKTGDTLGLSAVTMYYSWFNITAQNNNNYFQYKFFNNNKTLDVFTVIINDGFYSIESLFEFLQSKMVDNGHFLIDPNGDFVYFIELLTNPTYYSVQIKLSSISKMMTFNGTEYDITNPETETSYRIAGNWLPDDNLYICPQLIIPSSNLFGELIGFKPGVVSYDSTLDIINKQYSILNDNAPNMEFQNNIIITSNMIKNELGRPQNILTSFSAIKTAFGDAISGIHEIIYSKITPGLFKELHLSFFDENFKPLMIRDPNMTMNVSIIRNVE